MPSSFSVLFARARASKRHESGGAWAGTEPDDYVVRLQDRYEGEHIWASLVRCGAGDLTRASMVMNGIATKKGGKGTEGNDNVRGYVNDDIYTHGVADIYRCDVVVRPKRAAPGTRGRRKPHAPWLSNRPGDEVRARE